LIYDLHSEGTVNVREPHGVRQEVRWCHQEENLWLPHCLKSHSKTHGAVLSAQVANLHHPLCFQLTDYFCNRGFPGFLIFIGTMRIDCQWT
jgi:hypothetical protein